MVHGSITGWIDRLKAGDRAAASPLWDTYFRRLVQFARERLRGASRRVADEEDAALSAFDSFCSSAACGRFPQLADRRSLWPLLAAITRHKCVDLRRRESRHKRGGHRGREGALDDLLARGPSRNQPPSSPTRCAAGDAARRNGRPGPGDNCAGPPERERRPTCAGRLGCARRSVERKLAMIVRLCAPGDHMSAATFDAFTPTLMCLINDRCNRFEAVWQAGGRPEIEDFLTGINPDARGVVLAELRAIEAEYLVAVRIGNGTGREANRTNMWHDGGDRVTMARAVPRPLSLGSEPLPTGPPVVGPHAWARMSIDVTHLLEAAAGGDRLAAAAFLPLVYDELRTLAAARMAAEPVGHTLDATALVHEAYVRLVGPGDQQRWQNRGHFFAAAAEAMRRILIESARRRGRRKRGGDRRRVALPLSAPAAELAPEDPIDLDEALVALAAEDSAMAELVKLRSFGGLSVEEAAACLGISRATADRYWTYARAWLFDRLRDAAEPG